MASLAQNLVLQASEHSFLAAIVVISAAAGFHLIARSAAELAASFIRYFIQPGKNLKKLGAWAAVTGCTDGIGKAYAAALAKQGLNVVLISRTESKLRDVASELESKYKVQTKVVAADFTKIDEDKWQEISEAVQSVPVGVLVNSAGLSYDHAEYFDQISDEEIANLIAVNVVATTRMCRIAVVGMKSRKKGAIINIGSAGASCLPTYPLYAVYAGTKSYVDSLTNCLDVELAASGITVQNQAPFYVATKMSKIRKPRLDAPSPAVWVAAAIKQVGLPQSGCSPYWVHGLMAGVIGLLPTAFLVPYLLSSHEGLRARYFKKKERDAKAQ